MPRPNQQNLSRPARETRPLIPVEQKNKVRNVMDRIPAKVIDAFEGNPGLKPCCKNVRDHDIELFKTHEELVTPNMAIITCSCGRKHYRAAAGGVKVSN